MNQKFPSRTTVFARRWRWSAVVAAFTTFLVTGWLSCAFAHPDLEEQIATLTSQLEREPANADLFLRRADVYGRHAQIEEALADFAAAERLKPGWRAVALGRARLFIIAGRTTQALAAAEQVLSAESGQPDALVLRARCYTNLNRGKEAVADYSAALAGLPSPSPDLFLERARVQADLGQLDDAIKGLDEGTVRLGEIPALVMVIIEYERRAGQFVAALARVDRTMGRYPVKEPWLALRGEILEQSGRPAEARDAFKRVLEGIETYPPLRRRLELTRQLEARAREGLARVEPKIPGESNSQPTTLRSDLR